MKVVVTGSEGFIGKNLAIELKKNYEVYEIDNRYVPHKDITNDGYINDVFKAFKPEIVYHFAAYASEGLSHIIKRHIYHNNVVGSMNIINACVNNKVTCLVNASSVAAIDAIDTYGLAKKVVEDEIVITHKHFGLNYVNLRLHNVYGEYQNVLDPYRNVVGRFISQVMKGEPITVYGDGLQTRSFTYIKDIVPHIIDSHERLTNLTLLLGSDASYSVIHIANLVRTLMGKPNHEIVHTPTRDEVKFCEPIHDFQIDSTPIETGIKNMIEWAIKAEHSIPFCPEPEIKGHGIWRHLK